MSAYTLSANTNIDALTSKAGGDTYDTNGWVLTIDQDTRVGLNATTSASMGTITVNATVGGNVNIDGTAVRLIAFTSGSGTVPAWNTVITQAGHAGSGKLMGVFASFTSASTATGASMPASGYIRVKQTTGTYASGALTGITATSSGADTVGWIEVVGDESSKVTANRLGQFNITGAWFPLGTTSGASNQTLQIPNNGLSRYVGGVFIEQNAGAADYEFYPNAGTTTTTGTEAQRGKVVWIDATGLVRIGNSGAATNGYTPASGLAVVIGNVFLENATVALRTANAIPNATIGTRKSTVTTGGGVVSVDKCAAAWYFNLTQPYSAALTNSAFIDAVLLDECATAIAWSKVGVGNKPTTALVVAPLTMTLNFVGGTMTDCVFAMVSQSSSGNHVVVATDNANFTFTRCTFRANTIRGNATTYSWNATRLVNCSFVNCTTIQGSMTLTTCSYITDTGRTYIDCVSGTTVVTYAMYIWSLLSNTNNCTFSGLSMPITNAQPYTALLSLGAAGCSFIKLRNIGTRTAPLNLGSANATGLIWIAAASAAASDCKIQRVYCSNTRTGQMTADNSSTRITCESVFGDYADAADVGAILNYYRKGLGGTLALTAQTAVYGTHWFDCFTTGSPANLSGQSWTRVTTTATLTSVAHGLKTGDFINVTVSSVTAAIILGQKTITVTGNDTFTFTCLNAGATSGTLTYVPYIGRLGLLMNEASSITGSQVTLSNGAAFTAVGGLYMPTIGHQAIFTLPYSVIGIDGFPIVEAVMAGGTIGNYDILYSMDGGSTWKNLYYPRSGGGGTNGQTNVTMTNTSGVNANDYVTGTNIAPNAKVVSITNGTTIVVDTANIGAVSGVLRFNQIPNEVIAAPAAGFGLSVKITTSTTNATAITSFYWWTTSASGSQDYQYPLDPVTITVSLKDAATSSAIVGTAVYLEADVGGPLPALVSVSITRSGSTATVAHTAHGLATGAVVAIRGANQPEYNGRVSITYIDANSYSYTVSGTPATPATGSITCTAQIIFGTSDGSGNVSGTFSYTGDQPVTGKARKGTASPLYRTAPIAGTVTSSGFSTTSFMVKDE